MSDIEGTDLQRQRFKSIIDNKSEESKKSNGKSKRVDDKAQ